MNGAIPVREQVEGNVVSLDDSVFAVADPGHHLEPQNVPIVSQCIGHVGDRQFRRDSFQNAHGFDTPRRCAITVSGRPADRRTGTT